MTALAAIALVLTIAGVRDTAATEAIPRFEPGGVKCLETLETPAVCDGDTSAGAVADLHTRFCVGWNQDCSVKDAAVTDSAFGGVVDFIPTLLRPSSADDAGIGAIAGRITSELSLGILNNPCSTVLQGSFTLLVASTDLSNTVSAKLVGDIDVLEPLAIDANGNGLPDGVDRYPSFLIEQLGDQQPIVRLFGVSLIQGSWSTINLVIFEPGAYLHLGGDTVNLSPSAGMPAVIVLGDPTQPDASGPISDSCAPVLMDLVLLGQTVDNPCTPQPVIGAGCPGAGFPFENRGYPLFPCETGNVFDEDGDGAINDGCPQSGATSESGDQCEDNISDDIEDVDVNDGCPQVGDSSEADRLDGECAGSDEGGCIFLRNPATAGIITSGLLANSLRDADGDGIENRLDVCVFDPNPEWKPRIFDAANDLDADGLPNECDPDPGMASHISPVGCPAGVTGLDEDQDCYSNRQDNCPLVNQLQDPLLPPSEVDNLPILTDRDGDDVGDACDPHPDDPDAEGELIGVCLLFDLELGVGGAPVIGEPAPLDSCVLGPQAKGDVNCDGQINPNDGLQILRGSAGIAQPALALPPLCEAIRDMDCDGDVDAVDALQILLFIAGLPTNLPGGCLPLGSPAPV